MTMSLHTACRRGKTVLIRTHDGRIIIDKFIERTRSKWIVLERFGRIHVAEVRAFAPYRKLEGK